MGRAEGEGGETGNGKGKAGESDAPIKSEAQRENDEGESTIMQ